MVKALAVAALYHAYLVSEVPSFSLIKQWKVFVGRSEYARIRNPQMVVASLLIRFGLTFNWVLLAKRQWLFGSYRLELVDMLMS